MINLANSTSTMYIQNTIFRPCVKSISQVVAEKLYTQMVKDKAIDLNRNSELFFFSEEKYIEEKPNEFDQDRIVINFINRRNFYDLFPQKVKSRSF